MLRKLSLFAVSAVLLGACQTQPHNPAQTKLDAKPMVMQACTFRSEVCIMQYDPVCGYDTAGRQLYTYGNACSACAQPEVHNFTSGECNGSKN